VPALSHLDASVPPATIAALLLVARAQLRRLALPHPTATAILAATQVTKSRAYELGHDLCALLPSLARPAGRPARTEPNGVPPEPDLSRAVLSFVMDHPGCVTGSSTRRSYADIFRRRILELREAYAHLDLDAFAGAAGVARGTLEDWLRAGQSVTAVMGKEDSSDDSDARDEDSPSSARIQSVLAAWSRWHGSFTAFCEHVQHHLRIAYGRGLVARILQAHGERRAQRRQGRAPDESATRDSFEVFFPGAQWVGDGMQVPVEINDERFTFNLELDVDAYSGAVVGASVRAEEDSQAVVDAFAEGVATTGRAPLALLLDWRPSNHTPEVDEALVDTLRMRATRGRAQNKAHVEGAFGLFSQDAPPLCVRASSLNELAHVLLEQRVATWARTLNHRPRADRQGRSRVELYRDAPSAEQITEARRALAERCRLQEKRAATTKARTDPVVREALTAAFERLQLSDPGEHIRLAIAGYGRDAALDGIAIFEGKKKAATLPDGADARYLLGIVRNLAHLHESDAITDALLRERLAAHDRLLRGLEHEREDTLATHATPGDAVRDLADHALAAERMVDRLFWLRATGDAITAQPVGERPDLFRTVARRIHATFVVSRADRYAAERILARHVWPVT